MSGADDFADMRARLEAKARANLPQMLALAAGQIRKHAEHFKGRDNVHSRSLEGWACLIDQASEDARPSERERALATQIKNLIGVIEEYKAMKVSSLEDRMYCEATRAQLKLERMRLNDPEGDAG